MKHHVFKKKAYFWITLLLFLLSLVAHWFFGWKAFVKEELAHHQVPEMNDYLVTAMRDTMENWQSEFLQLIWQVVGLSFLWYVGSPASKEGDERKEAKIDHILRQLDPEGAERLLKELEEKYPKK
jgi:hypothetical protein